MQIDHRLNKSTLHMYSRRQISVDKVGLANISFICSSTLELKGGSGVDDLGDLQMKLSWR